MKISVPKLSLTVMLLLRQKTLFRIVSLYLGVYMDPGSIVMLGITLQNSHHSRGSNFCMANLHIS